MDNYNALKSYLNDVVEEFKDMGQQIEHGKIYGEIDENQMKEIIANLREKLDEVKSILKRAKLIP